MIFSLGRDSYLSKYGIYDLRRSPDKENSINQFSPNQETLKAASRKSNRLVLNWLPYHCLRLAMQDLLTIKTQANLRAIAVAAEGFTAAALAGESPSLGGSRAASLPSFRYSSICSQCKGWQLNCRGATQPPHRATLSTASKQAAAAAGLPTRDAHQALGALANTLDVRYILAAVDLGRPALDNISHLLQCACCIDSIPTCNTM